MYQVLKCLPTGDANTSPPLKTGVCCGISDRGSRRFLPVTRYWQHGLPCTKCDHCSGWARARHLPAVLQRVATKPDTLKIPAAPRAVCCTGTPILTACASSAVPRLSSAVPLRTHASAHAPLYCAMAAPQLYMQGECRLCASECPPPNRRPWTAVRISSFLTVAQPPREFLAASVLIRCAQVLRREYVG